MGRLARPRLVRVWPLALAAGTLLVWLVERVEVEGTSMSPTFEPGDRLLLVRRHRPLRVGDVVSLLDPRDPGRRLVKRVVALRGDGVEVRGDNEASSTDSRTFGSVRRDEVTHLVVRRYARASS